jgi:hypothetical protein
MPYPFCKTQAAFLVCLSQYNLVADKWSDAAVSGGVSNSIEGFQEAG